MSNTHFNHPEIDYDENCVACLQARIAELEGERVRVGYNTRDLHEAYLKDMAALRTQITDLEGALEAVVTISDRKHDAWDRAHELLAMRKKPVFQEIGLTLPNNQQPNGLDRSMAMPDLKRCPFCGGKPTFSEVVEEDERRYMSLTLDCCVVMKATLGWGTYRSMTTEAIQTALQTDLIERWNARVE